MVLDFPIKALFSPGHYLPQVMQNNWNNRGNPALHNK